MRSVVLRMRYAFGDSLAAKLALKREAVRFEAQNFSWTVQELHHYSDAVARGLYGLGLRKGDKLLVKASSKLQSEIVATRLAAAKIGAEVKACKASSVGELGNVLKDANPQGLIFDPTLKVEDSTLGSSINKLFPKLHQLLPGQPFKCETYPSLKFLIQTGFYSLPGVLKFQNILNYASQEHSPFEAQEVQATPIPDSQDPIVVLNENCTACFKAGLGNAVRNGRFVIYAEKNELKELMKSFPNAQVLSNEDVQGLPETSTLVTPKKRNVNSQHPKRLEI